MTRGQKIVLAGIVVAMGIGMAMATPPSHSPFGRPAAAAPIKKTGQAGHYKTTKASPPTPEPALTPPAKMPSIPTAGRAAATSAQASLMVLTQKEGVTMPAGPIDVVTNLADPTQRWAFATESAKGASTGDTLWFGEQNSAHGSWRWIPSTLPDALSKTLPPAVYAALQWAYDLHEGQTGPALYGNVSWSSVTGQVGEPEGWTAQERDGALTLTVWVPSYTGTFNGFYGVQTVWYASTIAAGQSGLSMIVPAPAPLARIAQDSASGS